MYLMWLLLMPTFVLSEENNPVFSTVSTTPSPSNQETNQILTQLQEQRSDLIDLQIKNSKIQNTLLEVLEKIVNNRTCPEEYDAVFSSKLEKTIEDKIIEYHKHQEQEKSEVVSQNKEIEQLKTEVRKLAAELDKMNDLLKKINATEATQKLVTYPEDCRDIQKVNSASGVYKIKPRLSPEPFEVLCEMDTQGGGWVHVINRIDGSQDFYLKWEDYKKGFGKLTGEFWLGLNHLYELTNSKNSELLIELEDWDGKSFYALYKKFSVGNEQESFKIKLLSGFSGNTTDMMVHHVNHNFITPDRDNNNKKVVEYRGPWWYHGSFHAKLTGVYFEKGKGAYGTGIHWGSFHGYTYCLKKAKMLIRPS